MGTDYVVERNERGGDDNTYEWVANGVTAEKKNLQNLPPEVCRTWYEVFKEKKNIMIEDIEEIRDVYPVQYAILRPQNIRSLVVFPLYEGKHIIGFTVLIILPKAPWSMFQICLRPWPILLLRRSTEGG